jgi:tripartite-type tricarboxylate transporter receptor subunit TctC
MKVSLSRTRRDLLLAAAAAAFGLFTSAGRADDYPSRPVKIIVPFGAGGPTDVYVRALAAELEKSLRQTFFIENRPGAGTTIGTDCVAKSTPDGYTLLMASSTQTVNETLYANKQYQLLRDLVPIAPLEENDLGVGRRHADGDDRARVHSLHAGAGRQMGESDQGQPHHADQLGAAWTK